MVKYEKGLWAKTALRAEREEPMKRILVTILMAVMLCALALGALADAEWICSSCGHDADSGDHESGYDQSQCSFHVAPLIKSIHK